MLPLLNICGRKARALHTFVEFSTGRWWFRSALIGSDLSGSAYAIVNRAITAWLSDHQGGISIMFLIEPALRTPLYSNRSGARLDSDGNIGQQRSCLDDNAVLKLWIAHESGALHGMAAFVIVDTGLTGRIEQDLRDYASGSLRRVQNLDERRQQRDEAGGKDAEKDVHVAVETRVKHDARFDGIDM